jgi:hypothetical protein
LFTIFATSFCCSHVEKSFDNLRNNKEYQLVLIGLYNIRLLLLAFRVIFREKRQEDPAMKYENSTADDDSDRAKKFSTRLLFFCLRFAFVSSSKVIERL